MKGGRRGERERERERERITTMHTHLYSALYCSKIPNLSVFTERVNLFQIPQQQQQTHHMCTTTTAAVHVYHTVCHTHGGVCVRACHVVLLVLGLEHLSYVLQVVTIGGL